ncbi:MAG TPA: hypothetical protein VJR89_28670 [Polyangiales bacterium]|nr:hypothetical protein [Polyangiales bacterium]
MSATIEASRLPAYDPKLGDFPRAGSSAADGGGGQPDAGSDAAQPDAGSGESDGAIAEDAGNDAGADSGTDSGTDSGPAPECVRRGPEQCSNAIDDDCNGDVDCADAACGAMMCSPAGSLTGILVPSSEDCPNGFMAGDMTVYQGLTDMGCAGCSCSTTPTTCSPHVYYYSSTTACTLDSVKPYTGGTLINKPVPQGACNPGEGAPFGEGSIETPVAWRVTMSAYPGTCSASGSASPLPPTWATTMKLCTTKTRGGGCAKGFACVPKVAGKQHCAQPSAASCPASAAKQTWQRGFSDNRSCGLCGCTASGGDCNDVVVNLGHDWGCGAIDSTLHGGEKDCNVSTYAPPAWWSGAPTNATCSSSAPVNGSLTATSPLDLCCVTD